MDLHSGGGSVVTDRRRRASLPRSARAPAPATALDPASDAYARLVPLLLIGIGGFAGAISRYLVDGFVTERTAGAFPWGTLVVNATGSFVLGLLFAATTERGILPAEIRGPVMIGFIGAYTTFSTYMLESWGLLESGSYGAALANLGGSVVVGLLAVAAGLAIGRAI